MESMVKVAWLALGALHVTPALVLVMPRLVERLYGVSPQGDPGVLLIHRGALFLAVMVATIWAVLDPKVRPLAAVIAGISMLGFLLVYARAGLPPGALRTIAWADVAGLAPLVFVCIDAWRAQAR